MGGVQTVVTSGIANRQLIAGIEARIQLPNVGQEEGTYLFASDGPRE
jgi:hypothetical protein